MGLACSLVLAGLPATGHPAAASKPAPLLACASGQTLQQVAGDNFAHGLARWRLEAQDPRAEVRAHEGVLDLQTPAGLSLWWREELQGDFELRITATALPAPATAGALAGRISDLNLFWHATEPDGREPAPRSGAFASYDNLRLYYVGIGANGNTTTRLRHYDGHGARTLLDGWATGAEATPQDRRGAMTAATSLIAGQPVQLQLLSRTPRVGEPVHLRLLKDGQTLFTLAAAADAPTPLQRGWFALRTTASRLQLRHFEVWQCRSP